MKNTIQLIAIILFSSVILFSGCKKKDDSVTPPIDSEQRARLSKTWVPETAVTFDGTADTRFTDFEITFTSTGTYTSSNGYPVFRTTGTWNFQENNINVVVLDDGTLFNITVLNDTHLKGNVNLQGGANARTTLIDGTYVFNLIVKP